MLNENKYVFQSQHTMSFAYIKLLHLISLIALFCASAYKNIKLHAEYGDQHRLSKILTADRISAASAMLMVITGLAMLLKDYPLHLFRLQQTVFWIKMAILGFTTSLIILSKLSLRCIARDAKNSASNHIRIPDSIKRILRIDLIGLALMATLAVVMVRC